MVHSTLVHDRLIASILVFGLFVSTASAQRVETIKFESKLVNAPLPYNVVLPKDYDTARATRYPVLYLLHSNRIFPFNRELAALMVANRFRTNIANCLAITPGVLGPAGKGSVADRRPKDEGR